MNDYYKKRQNSLTGVPLEEGEAVFDCIAEYFTEKWLNSTSGAHKIQLLWNRRDPVSTSELFSFGTNLKKLHEIDPKWTKRQVNQIKTDQLNNVQGALFEINALGFLSGSDQKIQPTKSNAPGYDGILTFPDRKEMRISLKNYGMSAAQREFNSQAESFRTFLVKILSQKKISSIQLVIDSSNTSVEKKDWALLRSSIEEILDSFKEGKNWFAVGPWAIGLGGIADHELHPDYNSYTLILSCPYHKNEEKNLIDKIHDACINLSKHSKIENTQTINCIFIRIPLTVSFESCLNWVKDYFVNFPEKPVSIIMLYQASYVKDLKTNKNYIHNFFQYVEKEDFKEWNNPKRQITVYIPVGKWEGIQSKDQIVADIDGKQIAVDIDGRYFYQRGDHYLKQFKDFDGNIQGRVYEVGPGIHAHLVLKITDNEPAVIMQGQFAPSNELQIL